MIKKLLLAVILLMSSAFSQVIATANPNVENPPYGMIAQLWNPTTNTIYLERIEVTGSPVGTFTGSIIFAFGLSNLEEQNCQAVSAFQIGGVSAAVPVTGVRVSQQPCTPHGLTYGVPFAGGCSGFNYTCTNFISLKTCYVWVCEEDFPSLSLAIPPNTGVTVYTARYVEPNAFGWAGYSAVHFRWHVHDGCPAQPINNLFCIQ